MNEQDERDIRVSELEKCPYTSGLVAWFGLHAVEQGAMAALGYPARLIISSEEAQYLIQYLREKKDGDSSRQ